jgi:hypothetical protein
MKRIIILLFLCFQTLFASIQEYELDDARVIVCDDFFLPVAKVGVFYSVGLNQLKNICEAEIIQEKFLSKKSKTAAKNLGIQMNFDMYDNFSEVSATVSSDQIADILKIISSNELDTENLKLTKEKIEISHKLSEYFQTDILNNEIYATINSKHIFNSSILDKFTEDDLKNIFGIYKKSPKTIVICGKLNLEKLIEELSLKKSSFNSKRTVQPIDFIQKNIEIRSKFSGRSLYYIYKHPDVMKNRDAILLVIGNEMFDYLKKHSQIVDSYSFTNLSLPNFFMLKVRVRRDVSKKSFESALNGFFDHLKRTNFSKEKLESISKTENFGEIDENEDIHAKYRKIVNQYIFCSQSLENLSERIVKISSEDIKNFVEEVFEGGVVAKISTQYKAES